MKVLVLSNLALGLYKFRKELLETLCVDHKVLLHCLTVSLFQNPKKDDSVVICKPDDLANV